MLPFVFMEMILRCIDVDSMTMFGKNISVARELSLESLDCPYMCFWLSLLNSVIYLSSSRDFRLLSKLSDHIEIILSLHSSANIFAFSHFNCQHEKRIHHSNTTDRANIQNLKFSITKVISQIVDLRTRLSSNSDAHASLLHLILISSLDLYFATLLLVITIML